MPKYLFQGSYTEQGLKGVLKEGGSKRREVVEQLAKGMGGTLEVFYYAFGGDDFFIIVDLPELSKPTIIISDRFFDDLPPIF